MLFLYSISNWSILLLFKHRIFNYIMSTLNFISEDSRLSLPRINNEYRLRKAIWVEQSRFRKCFKKCLSLRLKYSQITSAENRNTFVYINDGTFHSHNYLMPVEKNRYDRRDYQFRHLYINSFIYPILSDFQLALRH